MYGETFYRRHTAPTPAAVYKNKWQKDCLWTQRTHLRLGNGSLGLLKLFLSSNEVCNTAYAL